MSAYAIQQNPSATAYEAEYQAKWRKSEKRDVLEAGYLRTMPQEMRNGSFINDYTLDDEREEILSRIFARTYLMTPDMLFNAVISERDALIKKHAERKALADSED